MVDGEGVGERVVLMDVIAKRRGVIATVGCAGFRVEGDESRGILLKDTDDGGDLFGPGELVVVDEFHGGGVGEREVKGESGVIEEEFGRVGALGEPLELAELLGVGEGGAADGQIENSVVLGLAVNGQQQSEEESGRNQRAAQGSSD